MTEVSYENPQEMIGHIVCVNCHLANKLVDIEIPKAVIPHTIFEAVVGLPFELMGYKLGLII